MLGLDEFACTPRAWRTLGDEIGEALCLRNRSFDDIGAGECSNCPKTAARERNRHESDKAGRSPATALYGTPRPARMADCPFKARLVVCAVHGSKGG